MAVDGGEETRVVQLFDEALRHPVPSFALGERLSRLLGDRAMVEVSHFSPESFAEAGHCSIELAPGYQQHDTSWIPSHGIHRDGRCTLSRVTWSEEQLAIYKLTFPSRAYGDETRSYVIGRDRATCERFVEAVGKWNHEVRGEILVYKEGCFQKNAKLYAAVTTASMEHLILEGTFKEQILADFTQFLGARATYEEHGIPWKRGALFIGPPGNGKTLCVKALIRALGIPCIYVQSFESAHSTPQHGMEEVFKRARATTPCLIVLEDIDALLVPGSRSYFLNELDGFAANTGVITLATTNHPERLDPSIVERPSRFDRKYHFVLPTLPTRARYAAMWNERLKPALRLDTAGIQQLAEKTDALSFAYIQEVFVSSMMRWMNQPDAAGLLPVALEQVELLRSQMASAPTEDEPPPSSPDMDMLPPHIRMRMRGH